MDGQLTDREATVGTYQFHIYGGEQQDRAANRCTKGATLTEQEATSFAPMAATSLVMYKIQMVLFVYQTFHF